MSVLFFTKRDDFYSQRAAEFITLNVPDATIVFGRRGEPFAEEFGGWSGNYIISYLSPWIIPDYLLKRAKIANINFHPGPPEYPGIGCVNFAIYHGAKTYGVTCHHMEKKPDTGKIIQVERFPVFPSDTVYSLTQRSYGYIIRMFYTLVSDIIWGKPLPTSRETWKREPYKRAELNKLCQIDANMPPEEIRRRIRAVTFPGAPGGYIEIDGVRFDYMDSLRR